MLSIGTHILTFEEVQTILFEAANMLNERPIGTKTKNPEEGSYLCPNDLVMGRSRSATPSAEFNNNLDERKRWQFIQLVNNSFWKRWMRYYFHTLIVRPKWHTAKRCIQVGDIVLVQDSNAVRGQWKLAEVIEAVPGKDKLVRDVTLRYKAQGPGGQYNGCRDETIKRSVHRLVVLLPKEEQ